jgi:hypothetical protein
LQAMSVRSLVSALPVALLFFALFLAVVKSP